MVKKKTFIFHYISVVILYVFLPIFFSIFYFVFSSFTFYLYQSIREKDKRERVSISCFSMKNYTTIIFFPITVLFNFSIVISQ
jgi:hypothetical protein